jgi:hypothetical protein
VKPYLKNQTGHGDMPIIQIMWKDQGKGLYSEDGHKQKQDPICKKLKHLQVQGLTSNPSNAKNE